MKTTSLGAKLTRLHSGIGNAIMSLAMVRGLDKAVAALASNASGSRRRSRTPGPERSPGAKLRRAAHTGTLTVRHVSSTDQYWRDVYAKRLMANWQKRHDNAIARQPRQYLIELDRLRTIRPKLSV